MFCARHPFFAMTVLGAALLMPGSGAQAASEPTRIVMGPFSAVYNDAILAGASEAGRTYTVRSAGFTVNDLQQMKKNLDDNSRALAELQSLKQTVSEQVRQIEALKRDTGSIHSTGSNELSRLTRTTEEQKKELDKLAQQVEVLKRNAGATDVTALKNTLDSQARTLQKLDREVQDLKRNAGSSSSSGASEWSALKNKVDSHHNSLDKLERQLDDVKRSAGSNSSAADLSSLKREVSDQQRAMEGLKRSVEDLSRKVK